jgi:GNAT superfamily N-acetyltransferase
MLRYNSEPSGPVEIHPVTPDRWPDMEKLFGTRGASGGCWCMWWRLPRSEFNLGGERNHQAMKSLVDSGKIPGLLAYVDSQPAGWVSVAPREEYGALERSRVLKRLDDQPVWSIVCFYVNNAYRGQGFMLALIRAAVDYARENGAKIIEAYPVDPEGKVSPSSLYTGLAKVFTSAGFVEMLRTSTGRPILRLTIQ